MLIARGDRGMYRIDFMPLWGGLNGRPHGWTSPPANTGTYEPTHRLIARPNLSAVRKGGVLQEAKTLRRQAHGPLARVFLVVRAADNRSSVLMICSGYLMKESLLMRQDPFRSASASGWTGTSTSATRARRHSKSFSESPPIASGPVSFRDL
jgi:hypothetical protein